MARAAVDVCCRSATSRRKFGGRARRVFLWIMVWQICTTAAAARCEAPVCVGTLFRARSYSCRKLHFLHGRAPQPAWQASGRVVRRPPHRAGRDAPSSCRCRCRLGVSQRISSTSKRILAQSIVSLLQLLQVTAKYASVRRVLLIVNTCWTAAAAIYTRLG